MSTRTPPPGDAPPLWPRYRAAWALTLRCRGALLRYGYVQTALASLVLAPLLSWLVLSALRLTVAPAIANFDLAGFAASLPAVLVALVWSVGVAALVLLAAGGPVLILSEAAGGREAPLPAVLARVLRSLPRAAVRGAIRLTVLIALALPLGALALGVVGALALAPFGGLELDLILPDNFIATSVAIGGVLAAGIAALFLAIRWSFCLHLFLVEERPLGASLAASTADVRGAAWDLTRLYVAGGLANAALVAAVALLLGGWHWLALDVLGVQRLLGIDLALALLLAIDGVVLTGIVLLTTAAGIALVTGEYARRRRAAGRPLDAGPALGPVGEALPGPGRFRVALVLLLALGIGTALTLPAVLADREGLTRGVRVTAHRGNSSVAPDNTLASVQAAIEARADFAEIDVQEAQDGTLVVVHDTNLKALAGVARNVYEMTGPELAGVDVGSRYGAAFASERMPTLDQMITLAKGRIGLNIELKVHGHETHLAASAIERIRSLGFERACVITSLDAQVLAQVRRLAPEIPIGIILSAFVGDVHALDVDFYSVNALLATNTFIRRAHRHGRDVHVWTINEDEKIRRVLDRFPDNIITDVPARVIEIRDARTPEEILAAALRRLFAR
jgi:glycerophosphoryl diester phosphodiesterase